MNIFSTSLRKALCFAALVGSTLLSSVANAADFTSAIAGRVFCDVNCNNKIDVGVDEQLMKVKVQLLDQNGNVLKTTTPEVFGGTYIFPDLVPGKRYYVRVVPGIGQEVINSFPSMSATRVSTTVISAIVVQQNETYYPNDFLLSCCTKTWNQCEWGQSGCGTQPIDLIAARFNELFPNGVIIGGNKTLTFTSVNAILRFLPASGSPRKLIMTRTNPLSNAESAFAGNVLALTLNLAVSDEGITGEGLRDQEIDFGPLKGMTVGELLELANRVLGGETNLLPNCMNICDLNWYVEWANNRDWCDCCSCGSSCGGRHNGGHRNGCRRDRDDSHRGNRGRRGGRC